MKQLWKTKKAFFITFFLIMGIAGVATTYGYLTSTTGTVTNRFLPGEVNTHIEEEFGGEVFAGATVKKTPAIQNDGPSNAFIRARITVTPEDSNLEFVYGVWEGETFIRDDSLDVLGKTEGVCYNGGTDGRGWYYNAADGFYYFNMVTSPDENYDRTDTLFDAVKIGEDVTNHFDVTVYQEAVYADGLEAGTVVPYEKLASVVAKFDAVTAEERK